MRWGRESERRFKKALGVAPVREWSGDEKRKSRKAGSALWEWCFTRIEVWRSRPKNAIGDELGALMDNLKAGKMPVKKARSTVCAKAVRLLFRELVAELFPGNRE